MTSPVPVLGALVDWLKAGYPDGVPDQDYIPLLSLLARRLTDDEVAEVAAQLRSTDSADASDLRAFISKITDEPARREDVDRVRTHLEDPEPFL